ncbi:MAG: hypothetical protein ACWA5A_15070 [Marinibacterium sp.]
MIDQTLSFRGPAGCLDHVGLEPGLVEKDQPFQLIGHGRLTVQLPDAPLLGNVRTGLLSRVQLFFCVSGQADATAAQLQSDAP